MLGHSLIIPSSSMYEQNGEGRQLKKGKSRDGEPVRVSGIGGIGIDVIVESSRSNKSDYTQTLIDLLLFEGGEPEVNLHFSQLNYNEHCRDYQASALNVVAFDCEMNLLFREFPYSFQAKSLRNNKL